MSVYWFKRRQFCARKQPARYC